MIIVDGRTNEEKLLELLAHGCECTELDFKETLDLSKKKDELDLVKDIVAMHNHYPGGYLIIGAKNDGQPSDRSQGTDWDQFDGSKLTDKVRKYVEAPIEVTSQIHILNGSTYCLICVMTLPDGLPIPFEKEGQYDNGQPLVFRRGDIVIRDGASNGIIRYSQWGKVLKKYEQNIRDNEREHIDVLINRISDALTVQGQTPPLFVGMEDDALCESLSRCCEASDFRKLNAFVSKLDGLLNTEDNSLSTLTAVGVFAVMYDEKSLCERVIETLYEHYLAIDTVGKTAAEMKLELAAMAYAIGAMMVRMRKWDWILSLVNRPSNQRGSYAYASWLRDCQVQASRNELFRQEESGLIISRTNQIIETKNSLKPDIAPEANNTIASESVSNRILDSLCQFDMLLCICINAVGEGHGGAYPSCAFFKETRLGAAIRALLGNSNINRKKLLPNCSDEQFAAAFQTFWNEGTRQARQYGNWYWGMDETGQVSRFLESHLNCPE